MFSRSKGGFIQSGHCFILNGYISLTWSHWNDHIYTMISIGSYRYDHNDMIILIWSYWYDHIDIITLIWSYWYDHYDMITSNLYIFGGSVSIKFSWRLILKESTTIMRIDMLSFLALKGVNNLIMSLSLRRESCKWPNLLLIQISLVWSYHWYENVIYVIIILIWS